jgi:hypothetical protein
MRASEKLGAVTASCLPASVQHGADAHAVRRALSRDSRGQASGPLGRALDVLVVEERT